MHSAVNTLIWLYFQQHHPDLAITFAKEGNFDIRKYAEEFGTRTFEDVVIASNTRSQCKRKREKDDNICVNKKYCELNSNEKVEEKEELQNEASVDYYDKNNNTDVHSKDKLLNKNEKNGKKSKCAFTKAVNEEKKSTEQTQVKSLTSTERTVLHVGSDEVDEEAELTKQNTVETTLQKANMIEGSTISTKTKAESEGDRKGHKIKLNDKVEVKESCAITREYVDKTNSKVGVKQRFQRIDPSKVRFEAEELKHNLPHDTHLRVRQNQEMMQVKGKNFNKLKQKNKGKFYGAGVDLTVRSYQFPDSDEE